MASFTLPLLAWAGAPLLPGIINRTKAMMAGRTGAPLFQPYFDLYKLFARGAVYSQSSTWMLRLAPVLNLAGIFVAMLLMPLGGVAAPISFAGDIMVVAGLLGLGVFITMLAALDAGSSFEGMGASREAHFGAMSEPALFLTLAALAHVGGATSLSAIYAAIDAGVWVHAVPALGLTAAALLVLALVENARMPVDDPATHLELTMVHEVMVLDHTGPDLGMIQYGAALKLWLFGALLVGVVIPVRSDSTLLDLGVGLIGLLVFAVLIGLIESVVARMRLVQTPQLIVGAGAVSAVALVMALH